MSFIENYKANKRKRKLEEVNKALETLKKEHPFDPTSFKPKQTPPPKTERPMHISSPSRTPTIWTIILGVVSIILLILVVMYKVQLSSSQEDYDTIEQDLNNLQNQLQNQTGLVAQTQAQLQQQEEEGKNITLALAQEKTTLQNDLLNLTQEINNQYTYLLQINQSKILLEQEIEDLKDCVNNTLGENLNKCGY